MTEDTFFSGSHHQTPSFPLVHALSITDGHTEKEQPGTGLALLKAHSFTSRESRAQRWQTEPVLHVPLPVCSPGERVFSVVALPCALESLLTRTVRDLHLCRENKTLLESPVQVTVQLCMGCTASQKLPGSDRDLSFFSCKWKLSLHFCPFAELSKAQLQ